MNLNKIYSSLLRAESIIDEETLQIEYWSNRGKAGNPGMIRPINKYDCLDCIDQLVRDINHLKHLIEIGDKGVEQMKEKILENTNGGVM